MDLRKAIERLEEQTGGRATQWEEYTPGKRSDDELFFWCHGYSPNELRGKIRRHVRRYSENGFRVTITLEAVE